MQHNREEVIQRTIREFELLDYLTEVATTVVNGVSVSIDQTRRSQYHAA
jgi:hypothetical protein